MECCSLCLQNFDNAQRPCCYVCANKHAFCKVCVEYIFSDEVASVCPECRADICKSQVQLNRAPLIQIFEQTAQQNEEKTINSISSSVQNQGQQLHQEAGAEPINFFWGKLILISGLSWATQVATCIYLVTLGGYFRLGFLYPILFKFCQLIRNRKIYEQGSHRLLLKIGLFGYMEELEQGEILFYVQFVIRWVLAVSGITAVRYFYQYQWNPLSIVTLTLNVLSAYELYVCKKMEKRLLDHAATNYPWLGSLTLVILLLIGLVTSFVNLAFLVLSWYPLALIFLVTWFTVLIFSVTTQKVKTCCSTLTMSIVLILAYSYSIGMFCWLAIKHQLNRIPATIMLVFRHLICPLATVGFVLAEQDNSPRGNWMLVAAAVCLSELSFSIYLNSRT